MQVTETLSEGLKRAYTVVVPAADEKTLDTRLEAIIAAQKAAEAMISRRADGLKPGASDAPLRGFGA